MFWLLLRNSKQTTNRAKLKVIEFMKSISLILLCSLNTLILVLVIQNYVISGDRIHIEGLGDTILEFIHSVCILQFGKVLDLSRKKREVATY